MLRNTFYYHVKPIVPNAVRLKLRSWLARHKRPQMGGVWPVLPGSERAPAGWPGWPGGKSFAVVLTHDVEGPDGLERCRRLMEMEMKWGFRSSFNFIPEGSYRVLGELREELAGQGFEVGVHDLYHDGMLYRNREQFAERAARINEHLQAWGAVGFRSGFMFHNLDWIGDLNIEYDTSTFDTDPFEPQPDGVNTIFPFWQPGPSGRGYVELPYTLPQDSTLFLLLGERTPEIWLQKLEWLARHGGMVLLNTHPDYMSFQGPGTRGKYPVAHYESFLRHLSERYAGQYWSALPREVAAWYKSSVRPAACPAVSEKPSVLTVPASLPSARNGRASKPARATSSLRVCMICYSYYETDNRVLRYAEELARRGDSVDVLALRRDKDQPKVGTLNGVRVFRIEDRFRKDEQSKVAYLLPTLRFFMRAASFVTRQQWKARYDLIHVHNMPDFLVFAALFCKLGGTKIVLDIHDIFPEFYASKFNATAGGLNVRLLRWVERAAARFSDHVIISNHLWHDKFAARTGTAGRCSVFINNVNTDIFLEGMRRRHDGKFIIIFPGGLQWHQGVDIALRAFQKVSPRVPQAEFHIYGDGAVRQSLVTLARELGLDGKILFFDPVPVRQIAAIMADADLGVVPKRADTFGNEAYSTKIMEFMSLGVPVIVSETKIDRYYFNDSVVRFFPSGNDEALAEAMFELISQPVRRREMVARASEYAAQNKWETRKDEYLRLIDRLCGVADPKEAGHAVVQETSHAL
jgi:glycosyltransferase involved in cell wall biosynthesis